MEHLLFWTGAATWIILAAIGLVAVIQVIMDWLLGTIWVEGEFFRFIIERMKRKNETRPGG